MCASQIHIFFVIRAKHPVKVHVWAGISVKGSTEICIFTGIMNAQLYTKILERTLLRFLHDVFLSGHHFMQDNDPKHTFSASKKLFEDNGVHWWKAPPESPNANPIENLWQS